MQALQHQEDDGSLASEQVLWLDRTNPSLVKHCHHCWIGLLEKPWERARPNT